jgi:5-oxoprolinase (ATP-hydrolysing) subunit C
VTSFLSVVEPGLAATVQDSGRRGYQRFGVPMSGALDPVSLAVANILVGNPPGEAALEVMAAGFALRVCAESAMVAAAGAAAPFVLETQQNALKIPTCQSVVARRGDVLRFRPPRGGAAFFIAVAGGFDLPAAFGSKSTYRRARLGGYGGRALQAGDELPLRISAASELEPRRLDVDLSPPRVLRVLRGPNAEYFTPRAFETLFSTAYTVAPASDRMGLRLQGPPLERAIEGELPSQGTTAGAMQAPPDGQPILLLADRQTTGGYPCIATVIGADVPAGGRLAAGMRIRFEEVNRDRAIALLKTQTEWLASLPSLLKPVADSGLSTERLLSANLIGGVTAGGAEEE